MLAYLRLCAENHLYKDMNCLLILIKKNISVSMVRSMQNCYMWGTVVTFFLFEHISNTYNTNLMLDFTICYILYLHII